MTKTDIRIRNEFFAVLWARIRTNLFMLRAFFNPRIKAADLGWQEEVHEVMVDGKWVTTYVGAYRKKREARPDGIGHVTRITRMAYYERTL